MNGEAGLELVLTRESLYGYVSRSDALGGMRMLQIEKISSTFHCEGGVPGTGWGREAVEGDIEWQYLARVNKTASEQQSLKVDSELEEIYARML